MERVLKNCAMGVGAIALAAFAIASLAQNPSNVPNVRVAISPQALSVAPPALADKSALDPVDAKLHASLRAALDARAQGRAWTTASSLPAALRRGDAVLVEIRSLDTDEKSADAMLARHGVKLRNSMGAKLHEAWVPIDRLRELAGEASVVSVKPARLVQLLANPTISEGVVAGNADYWQNFNPAYTGSGIKIALIDSYAKSTIFSLQSSGDWPPNSRLKCYDVKDATSGPPYNTTNSCTNSNFGNGNVRHGDATMEIVYDLAPAAMYRAYDILTVPDWYNAILDAANVRANGTALGPVKVNVISASLAAPLDGKGDGSSNDYSIAQAAGYARDRGILVVNAAGNEREQHWGGAYKPASSSAINHSWNGTNTIYNPFADNNSNYSYCLPSGTAINVEMYWNNWIASGNTFAANHNYDLYLYQATNATTWSSLPAAESNDPQNATQGDTPTESIQFTTNSSATTTGCSSGAVYGLVVVRVSGAATDNLQVFANISLKYNVAARSLVFPADSPNVLSVAAIDVANHSTNPQEPFSSEGPVLANGGGLPNANASSDPNLKPDLASFDDVSTVSTGTDKFYGTSAATPHVAGMAALFMQRFGIPTSAATLDSKIVNPLRAIAATGSNDFGSPLGKDYSYGYGRLRFQRDAALTYLQQPSNTNVNAVITPLIRVGIYDGDGILDSYTLFDGVTLAFGNDPNGGAATITGKSATPVAGIATFNAAKINLGGNGYTLNAMANDAAMPPINQLTKTSTAFSIIAGTPKKLAFVQQPTSVYAGKPVTPAVSVKVEDASGSLVNTDNTTQVTLLRTTCTGQVPLGGGPVTVTAGVATFPDLSLYALAFNAQLRAAATGLTAATSQVFNVNHNTDILFRDGFESCSP